MICKYLLDENQQMKARLDVKTDPLKAKYENNLSIILKKALSKQFDMSDDSWGEIYSDHILIWRNSEII